MPIQRLLSLPPAMASAFSRLEGRPEPDWIAASDPPGSKLGSGGGSVHLLMEALRRSPGDLRFRDWLRSSRKLLIHGGGQSRRLPAYAATGKILAPMPVWRWATGQSLRQNLLDLQASAYERLLEAAPPGIAVMIASGDVLISFSMPEKLPEADVLGFGLWRSPEEAQRFGVFFLDRGDSGGLDFFLQKPGSEEIRELSADHVFLVDSGIWMLSEAALGVLFERCGVNIDDPSGSPGSYELYGDFATTLGRRPGRRLVASAALSTEVVALRDGEFDHFGTTKELIGSSLALQNRVLDQRRMTANLRKPQSSLFVQNARLDVELSPANEDLWIENSHIARGWKLRRKHAITGAPENGWSLDLEEGICLDFVPVAESSLCVRPYGFDDPFRGSVESATWLGRPASEWFSRRGIDLALCGIDLKGDIQAASLFPLLEGKELDGGFVAWLSAREPPASAAFRALWLDSPRLSADGIGERANAARLYAQRRVFHLENLALIAKNRDKSVFYSLDLLETARDWAATSHPIPEPPLCERDPVKLTRHWMFSSQVKRFRGEGDWEDDACTAFHVLRDTVVASLGSLEPMRSVLDDQIIWSRSPVRVDLAGGWTDTPPYCFMNGGKVVNAAIELNGQMPLQCFVRPCTEPRIVIRSIDLGIEEIVESYEGLSDYERVGSGFSIAKAALAQCGFHPRFGASHGDLGSELRAFGGGFDLSLLSAVPKGSGLGTSSILAGVVLAALGELCGFGWDKQEIIRRTMALEQMLGTGGGWQDQAGGLHAGLKLVESRPGFGQELTLRWLPETLLSGDYRDSLILLYYTGITRVAKDILGEIVRGMFLNSRSRLDILRETGEHALELFDAIQRGSWEGLCSGIARTWELKRALDPGTNPEAVDSIIRRVSDYLLAWKLPGAGGGGFLLMFAKDRDAAGRARAELEGRPPNSKARFVRLSLSPSGLQVTKS